jgi:hypothetical protein
VAFTACVTWPAPRYTGPISFVEERDCCRFGSGIRQVLGRENGQKMRHVLVVDEAMVQLGRWSNLGMGLYGWDGMLMKIPPYLLPFAFLLTWPGGKRVGRLGLGFKGPFCGIPFVSFLHGSCRWAGFYGLENFGVYAFFTST